MKRTITGSCVYTVNDMMHNLASRNNPYSDDFSASKVIKVEPDIAGGNFWTTKTSGGTNRGDLCGFALGGFAYVAGGDAGAPGYTNEVTQFNDTVNTWATKTSLTTARRQLSSFQIEGYGYAAYGVNSPQVNTLEQYNDDLNTWTTKTPGLISRETVGGFSLNGFGYVGNGLQGATCYSNLDQYNPTNNTWTAVANNTGTNRSRISGFSLNGFGYINGGQVAGGASVTNEVNQYNDAVNGWATKTAMPTAKQQFGSFTLGNYSYACYGGTTTSATAPNTNETLQYNDAADVWVTRQTGGTARQSCQTGITLNSYGYISYGYTGAYRNEVNQYQDHALYLIPGFFKNSSKTPQRVYVGASINGVASTLPIQIRTDGTNWQYAEANNVNSVLKTGQTLTSVLAADASGWRSYELKVGIPRYVADVGSFAFKTRTSMPTVKDYPAGFSLNGYGYMCGGETADGTFLSRVDQYYEVLDTWTQKTNCGTARGGMAGFSLNGYGYVANGETAVAAYSETNQYNDTANTWATRANVSTTKYEPAGCSLNGYGYSIGGFLWGSVASNSIDQYNDQANSWATKTVMPVQKKNPNVFALNGLVYATNGYSAAAAIQSSAYAYNDAANAWITKGNTSFGILADSAGNYVNNYGFVHHGVNVGSPVAYLNSVYQYNDSLDTWFTKGTTGTARRFLSNFSLSTFLYMCGGENASGALSEVNLMYPSDSYLSLTVGLRVEEIT